MTYVDLDGGEFAMSVCHPKTIKMRLHGIIERLIVKVSYVDGTEFWD